MANNKKRYLAIIPARGGSKGLPGKNTLAINGKPLIAWSIMASIESDYIDRTIVSTDDEAIASIAKQYGAEIPFLRPVEISGDKATTESALSHCLDWLKVNEAYVPDAIVLLQCTSPLRYVGRIDQAIEQFEKTGANSLLSVVPFWHFLWARDELAKGATALYDYKNRPRRQDIPSKDLRFKENGSLYICDITTYTATKNRLGGHIELFEMSDEESVEIDTKEEFDLVDHLLQQHHDAKPV